MVSIVIATSEELWGIGILICLLCFVGGCALTGILSYRDSERRKLFEWRNKAEDLQKEVFRLRTEIILMLQAPDKKDSELSEGQLIESDSDDRNAKWRLLKNGDVIEEGDEVLSHGWQGDSVWIPAKCMPTRCAGDIAPSPTFEASPIFRRRIDDR